MNTTAAILLVSVTVLQILGWLFRDRNVMAQPTPAVEDPTPKLRLGVYVGQHALTRARQRYGPDTTAIQVARDVTEALADGRHGPDLPAGTHAGRHARGHDTTFAWNHRHDRIYILQTGPKHVTVITALPPGREPIDTTSMLEALREALQRYGG